MSAANLVVRLALTKADGRTGHRGAAIGATETGIGMTVSEVVLLTGAGVLQNGAIEAGGIKAIGESWHCSLCS